MSQPTSLGTPQAYREAIAKVARIAGTYVEIMERFCAVGNDAGLNHAIRCLNALARTQEGLFAELKVMKAEQAERKTRHSRRDPPTNIPERGI